MTLTPPFLYRRSLSVASTTLGLSLIVGLGFLPAFPDELGISRPIDATLVWSAAVAALTMFVLWCIALINLIRDVHRGYSPSRCSLSALLLLFALVSPMTIAAAVLKHV